MSRPVVESLPLLTGKVCVLTGTTMGVAGVVAGALAKRKAIIVMLNRDPSPSVRFQRDLEVYAVSKTIHFIPCNLESWSSVSLAAEKVLADFGRVDLLVNNGQALFAGARQTDGGVDMATRANLLAHVQLTLRFFDSLKANGGRVVSLAGPIKSSSKVLPPGPGTSEKDYQAFLLSQARLLAFTLELSRRFGDSASAVCVNPGPVKNDPSGGVPLFARIGRVLTALNPTQAARTAISVATRDEGGNGELWGTKGPEPVPKSLSDAELGRKLWDWCEQALRLEAATAAKAA